MSGRRKAAALRMSHKKVEHILADRVLAKRSVVHGWLRTAKFAGARASEKYELIVAESRKLLHVRVESGVGAVKWHEHNAPLVEAVSTADGRVRLAAHGMEALVVGEAASENEPQSPRQIGSAAAGAATHPSMHQAVHTTGCASGSPA
eukprot:scaffold15744_cov69-Phaeocystis_antarctica.AAC.3